jgi:hypothetical protein
MAARAGIETACRIFQSLIDKLGYESDGKTGTQHGTQFPEDLQELANLWPALRNEIRSAILSLARAARGEGTD